MPLWQTGELVAVGADPYFEPDRQTLIFAADLIGKAGVVPIQVLVQNQGPRPVKVRRSEITLELFPEILEGGESPARIAARLSPIDASRVFRMLMGTPGPSSIETEDVGPRPQVTSRRGPEDGTVIYFMVLLAPIWIPWAIVSAPSEAKEREARLADYQAKEFQDAILDANTTAHGFLYFYPRFWAADSLREATLVVRVVDAEDESRFTDVRLRLSR